MLYEGALRLDKNVKAAIIASRFNHIVTDRLVEGAKDSFIRHGGDEKNLDVVLTPGAFEIPMTLKKTIKTGRYAGIVCIGAVIRGSTPHFDYIAAETTKGIAAVALESLIPVTFGVLTTDTIEQAIERAGSKAGNKGFEAMTGVIELIDLYAKLGE
ncbi:MAG: 6,7-dimethyl-8-ribityllumazine synthase [Helicobacteraceae bacterium]|jgi:6,7-dimethyl-8-ribityllumazine synthase|nr:6,7-dimethyl-8-ribityllumazine synthase [Helicobacteraceae bacterium]